MPVPDFSGINSSRHPVFKFLLEFTLDLFMHRNDKLKKRLQTRNVIPVPDFSGINLSGNP